MSFRPNKHIANNNASIIIFKRKSINALLTKANLLVIYGKIILTSTVNPAAEKTFNDSIIVVPEAHPGAFALLVLLGLRPDCSLDPFTKED